MVTTNKPGHASSPLVNQLPLQYRQLFREPRAFQTFGDGLLARFVGRAKT
jgi:hypothetical protein